MKRTMQIANMRQAMVAIVAVGLLSLGAPAALAQQTPQTADMTVTGTIVPAACAASFGGGGVVDFKTIRLVDLPNNYSLLGSKDVDLNITCSAKKSVRFSVEDLQVNSKVIDASFRALLGAGNDAGFYGLGTGTAGGQYVNLGGFTIQVKPSYADGIGYAVGFSRTGGGSGWSEPADYVVPDGTLYTPVNQGVPRTASVFRYPLTIKAALNKASALQVVQDTPLNGQAVFKIQYQ